MNRRALKTIVLTIGAVVVVLVLLTFVLQAMVFLAKIVILAVVVVVGILALRRAFPKSRSRDQ
jgi:hypothetical protein